MIDPKWLDAPLAFLIGAGAGFQGIYERWKWDCGRAAATSWGVLYLCSRGAVPTLVFVLWLGDKPNAWLYAIGCGSLGEVALRSRFYLRRVRTGDEFSEVYKGLFDLLRFWQGLFLELIAGTLAVARRRLVEVVLSDGAGFKELMARYRRNKGALRNEQDVLNKLDHDIQGLEKKYDAGGSTGRSPDEEQEYRHRLAYIILDAVGEKGLRTLLKP